MSLDIGYTQTMTDPQEVFATHGLCYTDDGVWMYDVRVPCEHPEWHKED